MSSSDISDMKQAEGIYDELGSYKDSDKKLIETRYNIAVYYYNNYSFSDSYFYYSLCGDYNNSQEMKESASRQSKLLSAAESYNKGDYKQALQLSAEILGVNSTKDGIASSNQICEWSKQKLYEKAISGKLSRNTMVEYLDILASYNYKDCQTRLYNIKYRYSQISGTYLEVGGYSTWVIDADYKTDRAKAILKSGGREWDFSGPLQTSGGTLGSMQHSSDIKFYQGYMTDFLGYRYNKVS